MCDHYEEIEIIQRTEEEEPTESDIYEARLARLRRIKAPAATIGELALAYLLYLLAEEFQAVARNIACEYETFWDDGRKLEVLERVAAAGMEPLAFMLCQRWHLNQLCKDRNWKLHQLLLPPLTPRAR